MKQIIKNLIKHIKKTIFKVQNKTNNKLRIISFDQYIINFNNFVKKTILKVQDKTNNKSKIGNLNEYVINFNNFAKKTILKVQNKKNNKSKISNFNRYVITFISLLFFYLFYLLIPLLYDEGWVQSNIESKILYEFKMNISTSANISYRILPSPHFLIKNSKISLNKNKSSKFIADVENLKVFFSQKNLFYKKKMNLTKLIIDNANFSLTRNEFKELNDYSNTRFSKKKIQINDSNIFLNNSLDELITIIKIKKTTLFFDDEKLLNFFNLRGSIFTIPFTFKFNSNDDLNKKKQINFKAKSLDLNFFNESFKEKNNPSTGRNIISFLNSTIKTKYNMNDELITFESNNAKFKNSKIDYKGKLSINPFDLNLYVDMGNYEISRLLKLDPILKEFIKTELLFNENISLNLSIAAKTNALDEIFKYAKINFNITNSEINLDNTAFINNIGLLELSSSNLFLENNELNLNTDILITIKDSKALFSSLNTNKKFRQEIKSILINIDYAFLSNEIKFNNIKIDNNEVSEQFLNTIKGFTDNNLNNLIKSRRLLNQLLDIYEG